MARLNNAAYREREYLTHQEVERLAAAAKKRRHGARDSFLIKFAYAHALREKEIASMKWTQIDFENACVFVRRAKNGVPAVHYLEGSELRALRAMRRENAGAYVFMTERGTPIAERTIYDVVRDAGERAGFDFVVHPHMLRHAKGFNLVNRGKNTREIQDYMGHANIQSTEVYTKLDVRRFQGFGGHHD